MEIPVPQSVVENENAILQRTILQLQNLTHSTTAGSSSAEINDIASSMSALNLQTTESDSSDLNDLRQEIDGMLGEYREQERLLKALEDLEL